MTHTYEINLERPDDDGYREVKVTVHYRYTKGLPEVPFLRNGDPGYPEEPAELEVIRVVDAEGNEYELTKQEEDYLYRKVCEYEQEA